MNFASAGVVSLRDAVFLQRKGDDRAAFRGLVGVACEQRGFGGLAFAHARRPE